MILVQQLPSVRMVKSRTRRTTLVAVVEMMLLVRVVAMVVLAEARTSVEEAQAEVHMNAVVLPPDTATTLRVVMMITTALHLPITAVTTTATDHLLNIDATIGITVVTTIAAPITVVLAPQALIAEETQETPETDRLSAMAHLNLNARITVPLIVLASAKHHLLLPIY